MPYEPTITSTLSSIGGECQCLSIDIKGSIDDKGLTSAVNEAISAAAVEIVSICFDLRTEEMSQLEEARKAVSKRKIGIVHLKSEKRFGLVFPREAWRNLGPFSFESNFPDALGGFLRTCDEHRTFSTIEVQLAKLETSLELKEDTIAARAQSVLFFVPYGGWFVHNQVDAVLASALRLRGLSVTLLGCDGLFTDGCYVLAHSKNPQVDCGNCQMSGRNFFSAFGLDLSQLRDFIDFDKDEQIKKWLDELPPEQYASAVYEDLPVGKWVTPAICSYFRVTPRVIDRPHVRELHRKYLRYALTAYYATRRALGKVKPDKVVLFSGNGFLHGPVFHLAQQLGIPVLSHEKGFKDKSFLIHSNLPCSDLRPQFEVADNWSAIPLSSGQLEEVSDYYKRREQGLDVNNSVGFYNFKTEYTDVRNKLRIPPDARIFCVFTSSEYELVYHAQYQGRSLQLEMIEHLMNFFRGRPEYLVVRHHPMIGGGRIGNPDFDFLTKAHEQARRAPPNVRVIMPHEELTSYALLWHTTACFAPISTVGIEAIARGVPSAVFDWIPNSRATTLALCNMSPEAICRAAEELLQRAECFGPEDLRRLYRFTYAVIFRYPNIFKAIEATVDGSAKINISSLEELKPGNDAVLDRVCDYLIHSSSVYSRPTDSDRGIRQDAEEEFFQQEVIRIKNVRADVYQRCSAQPRPAEERCTVVSLSDPGSAPTDFSSLVLAKQRCKALEHIRVVSTDYSQWKKGLEQLLLEVRRSAGDYVAIASENILYDESWLSASTEVLKAGAEGVFWGYWMSDPETGVSSSLFTNRQPASTYAEAATINPDLSSPVLILGTLVAKKTLVAQLLEEALSAQSADSAAEKIWASILKSCVKHTQIPIGINQRRIINNYRCQVVESVGARLTPFERKGDASGLEILVEEAGVRVDNVSSMFALALRYLEHGSNNECHKIISQIISIYPDIPDLLYVKALTEMRMNRNVEASSTLERLFVLAPAHDGGRQLLGTLKQAQAG